MDDKILQRYIEGSATPEEILKVAEWLEAGEANIREMTALHKLHDIAVWNEPSTEEEAEQRTNSRPLLRRIAVEMLKVAAVVAAVWLGFRFFGGTTDAATGFQTLIVPAGQRAQLILPDSSKVWLNSKSKIVYPVAFNKNNRSVELDGEAYFDITPDKNHPFLVKTPKMDIRVLGTEFNVIAYSCGPSSEVSLLRGCVELTPAGSGQIYTMKENERILLQNERIVSQNKSAKPAEKKKPIELEKIQPDKITVSTIKNYDYFEWRNGIICFDDETLEDMLRKLEIYYDVKISAPNAQFMKRKFTGKFRSGNGIEHVLKVIRLNEKFDYTFDEEKDSITIK